jgi:hypothetical protein
VNILEEKVEKRWQIYPNSKRQQQSPYDEGIRTSGEIGKTKCETDRKNAMVDIRD